MPYFIIRVADTGHNNCVEQMFGRHFVYFRGIDSESMSLYTADVSEACTFKSTSDAFLFWENHRHDILNGLPNLVSISLCSITSDEIELGTDAHYLNTLYNEDDLRRENKCIGAFTFDDFKRFVSPAIIDKIMQENPNASNNTLFSNILVELNSAWETVNGKCTKWVPGHFE